LLLEVAVAVSMLQTHQTVVAVLVVLKLLLV
jgi:hypothetical protein